MILTCRLCGEMIKGPAVPLAHLAAIPAEHHRVVEYQAAMIVFAQHAQTKHQEHAQTLAAVVQTYAFHLFGKLATASAADFNDLQTEGRRYCYWTLAEPFDGLDIKTGPRPLVVTQ